jgi:hypothetical protein
LKATRNEKRRKSGEKGKSSPETWTHALLGLRYSFVRVFEYLFKDAEQTIKQANRAVVNLLEDNSLSDSEIRALNKATAASAHRLTSKGGRPINPFIIAKANLGGARLAMGLYLTGSEKYAMKEVYDTTKPFASRTEALAFMAAVKEPLGITMTSDEKRLLLRFPVLPRTPKEALRIFTQKFPLKEKAPPFRGLTAERALRSSNNLADKKPSKRLPTMQEMQHKEIERLNRIFEEAQKAPLRYIEREFDGEKQLYWFSAKSGSRKALLECRTDGETLWMVKDGITPVKIAEKRGGRRPRYSGSREIMTAGLDAVRAHDNMVKLLKNKGALRD